MIYRRVPAGLRMPQFRSRLPSNCQRRRLLICPRASDLPLTYRACTLMTVGSTSYAIKKKIIKKMYLLEWVRTTCRGEAEVRARRQTPGSNPEASAYPPLCRQARDLMRCRTLWLGCVIPWVALAHLVCVIFEEEALTSLLFWQVLESGIRIGMRAALIGGFIPPLFLSSRWLNILHQALTARKRWRGWRACAMV